MRREQPNGDDEPELHTEADGLPPLSAREALAMGGQSAREVLGARLDEEVVYADVDGSVDNEDQADAHHAEPDEHL